LSAVFGFNPPFFACVACIVASLGSALGSPCAHQADEHAFANDTPLALSRKRPCLLDCILGSPCHALLALAPCILCEPFHPRQVPLGIYQRLLLDGHLLTFFLDIPPSLLPDPRGGEDVAVVVASGIRHCHSDPGVQSRFVVPCGHFQRCVCASQTGLSSSNSFLTLACTTRPVVHSVQDPLRVLYFVNDSSDAFVSVIDALAFTPFLYLKQRVQFDRCFLECVLPEILLGHFRSLRHVLLWRFLNDLFGHIVWRMRLGWRGRGERENCNAKRENDDTHVCTHICWTSV